MKTLFLLSPQMFLWKNKMSLFNSRTNIIVDAVLCLCRVRFPFDITRLVRESPLGAYFQRRRQESLTSRGTTAGRLREKTIMLFEGRTKRGCYAYSFKESKRQDSCNYFCFSLPLMFLFSGKAILYASVSSPCLILDVLRIRQDTLQTPVTAWFL